MAVKQINVTQLKCACLDTEWRGQWLRGENPPTICLTPPGVAPVYGTLFHKIAENYVGWLTSAKTAQQLKEEDALWHEMYERFAETKLTELLLSEKIASAYHLGECLKAFCRRAAELRRRTPNFDSWQDVYLTKEFSVKDVRFDMKSDNMDGNSIFVSGQIDAVRTHPEYGLEIADYKLSHGDNLKHDLLQLAIYAELLRHAKPGLRFHGVLEYYEPALHELPVSEQELETIFTELVQPVLCELAGYREQVTENRERVSPQADDLSAKIRRCYASFKLDVQIIDKQEAPQLIRYMVKPAAGVKVVSLANRSEDLQVMLSLSQPPLIEPAQGCVTVDIPKEKPDTVLWTDVVKDADYAAHPSPVSFPVGVGVDNRVMIADFADPNMTHILIGGASGSGKSEFLKSLVASLIAKNEPDTLKLSLIDPKILTFGSFSHCPYLREPVITEVYSAIPCLQAAVEEMNGRYARLGAEGFESLSLRFRAGKRDIPFYVIVFDEFADLILTGNAEKKEFETLTARLAAKGRAAGIHLVLATQRPDSRIVTGIIKANLPLKICLRVTTFRNSQIILDQTGGESLLGRGDLLCDRGKGAERAQSPYISRLELLNVAGRHRYTVHEGI